MYAHMQEYLHYTLNLEICGFILCMKFISMPILHLFIYFLSCKDSSLIELFNSFNKKYFAYIKIFVSVKLILNYIVS